MLTVEKERFTLRQRQVVHLISQGCSNLEIADRLGISPRTAKALDTLRVKLRVSRRRHSRPPSGRRPARTRDFTSSQTGALYEDGGTELATRGADTRPSVAATTARSLPK